MKSDPGSGRSETARDGQAGTVRSLADILDAVEDVAQKNQTVSMGDVVDALGRASSATLVFIPALIASTPLSGIPGLSAFCGIIIFLVAGQAAIGRRALWLPDFIKKRTVDGKKLYDGLENVRGVLRFMDRHTHERLSWLTTGPGARLLFVLCMLGGLIMPLLEVIPFSASTVAGFVLFLSIAILTLDGLLVIVAACFSALIFALISILL